MELVYRKEDADGQPAHQQEGSLALVLEAQLMRLVPAVHAGQGTEHRIDHQLRAARGEEGEGRDGHSDGNPHCRDVVLVGRRQAVERAEMRAEGLHGCLQFSRLGPDGDRCMGLQPDTPKACLVWFPQRVITQGRPQRAGLLLQSLG